MRCTTGRWRPVTQRHAPVQPEKHEEGDHDSRWPLDGAHTFEGRMQTGIQVSNTHLTA
jgi:hypothetical protein